jgi:hypothetical protein
MRPSPLVAALAILLLPSALLAVQPAKPPAAHPAPARTAEDHATSLPVTRVALYKNGVGFFEHTGRVSGDAAVTIDFTSGQLNDVLQSLTAIDLNGGRISGAGYNSTTPLDQQLKSLPLSLDNDATASDFYSAIRGARVEVHSGAVSITGRLLSVEARSTPAKSDDSNSSSGNSIDRYFLTVVSDLGEVRTLELTPSTSVRLLDTSLDNDVTRYLQLLDSTRSQGLRHLTLSDLGTGSRELRVSYISEVPIWKSTYRILFTTANPGATTPGAPSSTGAAGQGGVPSERSSLAGAEGGVATLQGWSVVDNTTGADWDNVQLSLIAGAPQSFIQPLSQPIYSRRPEIPIAQEAQLTPQTHDSSIEAMDMIKEEGPPPPAPSAKMAFRSSAGIVGGMAGGRGYGIAAGSAGGIIGGIPAPPPMLSYEDSASASIAPQATSSGFDDFFEYKLTQPITIHKNESALVPILQAKVAADPVTLVSYANGRAAQPLRALWITNTSGLTLDRGSFTIIEDGNFAGEGLLDPVHPDEKRLLSYAADQAVHVSTEDDKNSNHVTLIRGSKGVLNIHRAELHEVTLVLHNAAPTPRTIVSELPVVNGWKLDSLTNTSSNDPKPVETTATVYRFRNNLAPGETTRLHIGATRSGYTTFYLTRSDDNQLQFILNSTDHNSALVAALQPILDARRRVADAQTAVDQTNAHLAQLHDDEERQRANITALKDADKSSRDRFVNELNHTEDAINAAQSELSTRTSALDAAKASLATAIDNFSIDQTI